METLESKSPDVLYALEDTGAEFNVDEEWKWLEDFSPEFHTNAFDSSVTPHGMGLAAEHNLGEISSRPEDSSLNIEHNHAPLTIISTDEGPRFGAQLGVFDSPLDPGGFWPFRESMDSQPTFSSAQPSGVSSPRASMPSSRDRSRMQHASPGLPRRRSRYSTRRLGQQTPPILISPRPGIHDTPDPMQRWKNSPPEDEPASISAILNAVRSTERSNPADYQRSDVYTSDLSGHSGEAFRGYRNAASSTSGESGASKSSINSLQSENSSSGSSRNSSTLRSRKSRGRITKPRQSKDGQEERRIFCCTFCCNRFKSKYDWALHEKALHLNLEAWICAPFGGAAFSSATGRPHCAYCHILEPNAEHLESHNHQRCHGDSKEPRVEPRVEPRAFRRKDHLVQHLRQVHNLVVMPLIDEWKLETPSFTSRCGFCDQRLNSWDERADHIAAHYKQGSTMNDWHGEHEFPPSIAAQVTHSLPPYLIGTESVSMIPFSATDSNTRDHFFQISSNAAMKHGAEQSQPLQSLPENFTSQSEISSFTQVLTLHLGRYAQEQMNQGIVPTDDMFQEESRRLLYDCLDSWNQTVVDNGQWLSAFRQLHCQPEPGNEAEPEQTLNLNQSQKFS